MESISGTLGFVVAFLYVAVSGYHIALFMIAEPKSRNPGRIFAGITVSAHCAYLLYIVFQLHRLPMATVHEALSVTAFFISLMYIFIQFSSGECGTEVFVFPVAGALQLISSLNIGRVVVFDPVLASPFFALHTIPSIMAYAAFLISMFYSGMYHLMHGQIISRKFGLFYEKLPSLEALDSLNSRAISMGFILLTIGIGTGVLWGSRAWKDVSPLDPKIFISFVLWFLYGLTIFLRKYQGWRGKRVASLSLAGGIIVLFSFIIGSSILPSIHRFL